MAGPGENPVPSHRSLSALWRSDWLQGSECRPVARTQRAWLSRKLYRRHTVRSGAEAHTVAVRCFVRDSAWSSGSGGLNAKIIEATHPQRLHDVDVVKGMFAVATDQRLPTSSPARMAAAFIPMAFPTKSLRQQFKTVVLKAPTEGADGRGRSPPQPDVCRFSPLTGASLPVCAALPPADEVENGTGYVRKNFPGGSREATDLEWTCGMQM